MSNINKNEKYCELKDEELDQINGGFYLNGIVYEKPGDVVYKFGIGEHVEYVRFYFFRPLTKGCTVIDRKVDKYPSGNGYCAWYKVSCSSSLYNNNWYPEKEFERGFISVDQYTDM